MPPSHKLSLAEALATSSPHTFTIQYPPSRRYFQERFALPATDALPWLLEDLARDDEAALLYVHVPFCAQRCFYCNFAVDIRKSAELHARYVAALTAQMALLEQRWPREKQLAGIDIGGGTPTLLALPLLEQVLTALASWREHMPVTGRLSIETTPRVAAHEPDKLRLMRDHGVSRVSMGLQSTDDATLASVNRRAQRQLGDAAIEALLHAGFDRVSVDLVFGLPGQKIEHFREDIKRVIAHGVDALTIYDCLYRGEGRALPRLVSERPSAQCYGEMYDMAYALLTSSGYEGRYGGLNFCHHPGETGTSPYFEARLLQGRTYVGLGNYASSLTRQGKWWFAPYEVDQYTALYQTKDSSDSIVLPVHGGAYSLPAQEQMAKHLLANLNFGTLCARSFTSRFGQLLEVVYGEELTHACERGWLEPLPEGGYGVSEGAFWALSQVRALFYSSEALAFVAGEAGSGAP